MSALPPIGTYITALRKARQWTLKDLSEQTGLSLSYLSDIERGRTIPALDTLAAITTALSVSLADLFGGAELNMSMDEHRIVRFFRERDFTSLLRLVADAMKEQTA